MKNREKHQQTINIVLLGAVVALAAYCVYLNTVIAESQRLNETADSSIMQAVANLKADYVK